MKLVRIRPYLKESEVETRGLVVINKQVSEEAKRSVVSEDEENDGSILGKDVQQNGGAIPIPIKYRLINMHVARKAMENPWMSLSNSTPNYLAKECPQVVHYIDEQYYIYVPPGISMPFTTDFGLNVMTGLQKRFDDVVGYYLDWVQAGHKYIAKLEINWLRGYNRLLSEIENVLLRKGGLYDRAVGCLWEYSMRAVITPDPTLAPNEIEIPKRFMIFCLLKNDFREAFDIPEDTPMRDALDMMNGKRVLLGRQPSHDCSNLLSFKLRIR